MNGIISYFGEQCVLLSKKNRHHFVEKSFMFDKFTCHLTFLLTRKTEFKLQGKHRYVRDF